MKVCICFKSAHHQNTLKLLNAIKSQYDIDLINVDSKKRVDLSNYDVIGIASGIVYSKYYKEVYEFIDENIPNNKKVFFIHTAGDPRENQNKSVKDITDSKNCITLGTFFTKGFDTYGPFKLIGGINKGRPNDKDIQSVLNFYKEIVK